jgi:hypothetical protein
MEALQDFLRTRAGKICLVIFTLLSVSYGGLVIKRMFGPSDAVALASDRIFVCAETLKSFHVNIGINTPIPAHSPYSGKNTGYPAELCYWDKDGSVMKTPTAVLMNSYIGKSGPTFCPYCGRLVVGHNPVPHEGSKPPPTLAEYKARYNIN